MRFNLICFHHTDHVMPIVQFSFFSLLLIMDTNAPGGDEIAKELFPGVSSRGLYCGNKR